MELFAKIELRTLNTTGGHQVWPAAKRLLDSFDGIVQRDKNFFTCVLELGAGTGFLGLSLALRRTDVRVVLSEQSLEEAQALLRDNLAINPGLTNVSVVVGDFFDPQHLPVVNEADLLVIGSDLVYTREIAAAFPVFLAHVLRANAGSFMLYCHTFRRFDFVDDLLLANLKKEDLSVVELCSDGSECEVVAVNFESGTCFEEFDLFPEQQMRILKIYFAS